MRSSKANGVPRIGVQKQNDAYIVYLLILNALINDCGIFLTY